MSVVASAIQLFQQQPPQLLKSLNAIIPFTTDPTEKEWNKLFQENNKYLATKYQNAPNALSKAVLGQLLFHMQGTVAGKLKSEKFPVMFQDATRYNFLLKEAIKIFTSGDTVIKKQLTEKDTEKRVKILDEMRTLSEKFPYLSKFFVRYKSLVFQRQCPIIHQLAPYYDELIDILSNIYDSYMLIYASLDKHKVRVFTTRQKELLKQLPELMNNYNNCINLRLGIILEKMQAIYRAEDVCHTDVKLTPRDISDIGVACVGSKHIKDEIVDKLSEIFRRDPLLKELDTADKDTYKKILKRMEAFAKRERIKVEKIHDYKRIKELAQKSK